MRTKALAAFARSLSAFASLRRRKVAVGGVTPIARGRDARFSLLIVRSPSKGSGCVNKSGAVGVLAPVAAVRMSSSKLCPHVGLCCRSR